MKSLLAMIQGLLGALLMAMGGGLFRAGWDDFHSESGRMLRQLTQALDMSVPFYDLPGMKAMLGGGFAMLAALVLVALVLGGE